jgi:hypothetical protein
VPAGAHSFAFTHVNVRNLKDDELLVDVLRVRPGLHTGDAPMQRSHAHRRRPSVLARRANGIEPVCAQVSPLDPIGANLGDFTSHHAEQLHRFTDELTAMLANPPALPHEVTNLSRATDDARMNLRDHIRGCVMGTLDATARLEPFSGARQMNRRDRTTVATQL